ncbi:hypothetical protein [Rufibacter immobilis]|uniref:hypothetical protein n=1 Tax=Rufibacter immobilis TaxID=1348778 RepID=UPI0035EE01BF
MFIILLLGVLLFVVFYLIGCFFLQLRVEKKNDVTQHVLNFWVGLLVSVSLYALFKANLVTVLILIPLVLLSFRRSIEGFERERLVSTTMFLLCAGGLYIGMFFLQVNFKIDVLNNPLDYLFHLHPFDGERYVYSTIMSFLHYDEVETMSMESVLSGTSGVSLYHFLEFWLGSLFKTLYNAKSDLVLFYFVYPLFKTFTVLTIFSVFSDKIQDKKALGLVLVILFCFTVFGFLWITAAISKIHLRDIVMMPMLVLSFRALYLKKYTVAVALLMVASVEYVLFLPVLCLTICLFFSKYSKTDLLKVAGFLVAYGLFFYLFKEKVENKYFDLGARDAVLALFSAEKIRQVYRVLLLAVLTYPVRLVVAYFVLASFEPLKQKRFLPDIGYWVVLFFIGYHLLFAVASDMSLDAWQLKHVAVLLSTVAFVFLLYELVKRRMYSLCLVVLLLLSDYKYPFGEVEEGKVYDGALEKKLELLGMGKQLKGFFVDEAEGLPEKWALFYYPTRATDYARSNDFRMYLFNYDISRFKGSIAKLEPSARPILHRITQPLFSMETDILENAKKYDISIVWINKNSKYSSAFRNKEVLHELEDYYIYHIE